MLQQCLLSVSIFILLYTWNSLWTFHEPHFEWPWFSPLNLSWEDSGGQYPMLTINSGILTQLLFPYSDWIIALAFYVTGASRKIVKNHWSGLKPSKIREWATFWNPMILPWDLKQSENILHGLQLSPHFILLPLVSQCNTHCSVVSPWLGSAIRTIGLPRWVNVKEFTCQCRTCKTCRFDPWGGKIPWSR